MKIRVKFIGFRGPPPRLSNGPSARHPNAPHQHTGTSLLVPANGTHHRSNSNDRSTNQQVSFGNQSPQPHPQHHPGNQQGQSNPKYTFPRESRPGGSSGYDSSKLSDSYPTGHQFQDAGPKLATSFSQPGSTIGPNSDIAGRILSPPPALPTRSPFRGAPGGAGNSSNRR